MKELKLILITLTYFLFFSSFQNNHDVHSVEILRYWIGKTEFQSIELKKGIISKWMKNKSPLVMQMNDLQKYELNGVLAKFDLEEFKQKAVHIQEAPQDVYPKIYYRFIVNGDTIQTKDFVLKEMPEEVKLLDKLLIKYTTPGFRY